MLHILTLKTIKNHKKVTETNVTKCISQMFREILLVSSMQ